jgi:SAM-dependent methyltransferase
MSTKKTKEYWGKEAGTWEIGKGEHWTEHIAIQERINWKASGDYNKDPYQYFIDFLSRRGINLPLSRCLTLGCGAGDLERGLSKYNFCKRHDAYDIADKAIERARDLASKEGLTHIFYEVADINNVRLSPDTYDVILAVSSVHHFTAFEHIFSEIRKALKQSGFFFLNEFVGPAKFQWTDKQLNIVNSLLQILPVHYRKRKKDGTIKSNYRRPTIEEMNNVDPSEAVRSQDILSVLAEYFEIVEKKDLGGTILHLLLQDIVANFDFSSAHDMKMFKMLFEIEDAFLETGEISSDFAVIIAMKR